MLDRMGRIVIPKEFRKQLGMENEVDSFEITMEENRIVLRKYEPHCIFCGGTENCTDFRDQTVCIDCLRDLQQIETETPPNAVSTEE
ncbi:MAG: AbrB/MazE/SpoVT family DNA-binding domain-containing protein [Clostridia bacterium]|nr:AbrB/MazE/SpoVT family DNA-binding domain-containing protein [Clostridia bacterium]